MRSRFTHRLTGRFALTAAATLAAFATATGSASAAQPTVGLGTAASFAVLAGSAVTNTGPSTINGDLGVSPGTAVTGFPPGTVNGTTHQTDAVAAQAQADLTTAYNDAASRTPPTAVPADLTGLTLTAGVYRAASALSLTGALTLDAQGDPNAVFVFQASSTLITASASQVNLINGAQACNVFWQVGSSATLGSSSLFTGSILALTSISVNNAVTVNGRALARNGAVTLINDTISAPTCATSGTTTTGGATGSTGSTGSTGTTGTSGGSGSPIVAGSKPGSKGKGGHSGTAHLHGHTTAITVGAKVTGKHIRKVVFTIGGKVVASPHGSPFTVTVARHAASRTLTAHVTFTDSTHPVTLRIKVKAKVTAAPPVSAPAPSKSPQGPSGFTG